jgi:hypothetical protein
MVICGVDCPQRSIKPFDLARRLSSASDLPSHSYGLLVMPRKFGQQAGLVVAIIWSTDDWEQLDVTEMTGTSPLACKVMDTKLLIDRCARASSSSARARALLAL